ncbi:MAG: hypothetical protein HYV60_11360 [Planctomycetia bacterium]|nr:hypothetical protein [Planctomycetia bacterium]
MPSSINNLDATRFMVSAKKVSVTFGRRAEQLERGSLQFDEAVESLFDRFIVANSPQLLATMTEQAGNVEFIHRRLGTSELYPTTTVYCRPAVTRE